MSNQYEIYALKYGERLGDRRRKDSFIFDDAHDIPHSIDYFIWVVRNKDRTIVVDCGYDEAEGERRGRKITRRPREALKMLDIDAEEVDELVVTHLHYDHAGTLNDFPKAKFHLQEAEMAYATGKCMCHGHLQEPFTAEHVCDMVKKVYQGKVQFHDGDVEIAPGLSLHKMGGHSLGLQSLRVNTQRGNVVLASDASHFYENFEKRKPFPIVANVQEMLEAFDKLYRLADSPSHIIPGHDPLVKDRYPVAGTNMDGVVYRLDVEPSG